MPLHALELVLDAESDAWVRGEWAALAGAGLPSQARHRGPTNAPHVTLASAPAIPPEAQEAAVAAVGPLLPMRIDLLGAVLLGRGPYAFARLLAPRADLDAAARAVRRLVADPHSPGWLAHVTLARRLAPGDVGAAIAAVATGPAVPRDLVVAGLRLWDPDAGTVCTLAGSDAPGLAASERHAGEGAPGEGS